MSSGMTFSFWVKCNQGAGEQTFYSDAAQGSSNGFIWIYRAAPASNSISFQYWDSTGATNRVSSTTQMFNNFNNAWVNIAITVNYSGAVINWYKNGVLLSGPNSLTGTPVVPISRVKFIGSYNATPSNQLLGNISNVMINNVVLTASEILQNYNALKSRYGY